MGNIPLFYRIFFLYIDPLICLSGVYIFFFAHPFYIENGLPSAISGLIPKTASITPLTEYLLIALGSYSLFVFTMQILLLHQFRNALEGMNVRIWRIVIFGILLIDLGLIYGVYKTDPKAFWNVSGWKSRDWTNNGILGMLIVIRSAFLLGIGGVGAAA
jgi:hypothetical protein